MRALLAICLITTATACAPAERSENSAICGITMLASTAMIATQLTQGHVALTEAPKGLEGRVATRAVGYGTTPATAVIADDGTVAVEYAGHGFPETGSRASKQSGSDPGRGSRCGDILAWPGRTDRTGGDRATVVSLGAHGRP